jgi:(2Fe-2S) ferredoxin
MTDQAVYRDGTWYLLQSAAGFTAVQFGVASDIPALADYDGGGRLDAAVYREGTWYLLQSTNGISIQQFGIANDKPVPAAFLP